MTYNLIGLLQNQFVMIDKLPRREVYKHFNSTNHIRI